MSFIEHGLTPAQILFASTDAATREGIRAQIRLACEDELGDVVLRLSTEDCFDLLCDLAVRHGRDLKQWGPPCACSFAKCLPCLDRLVESVRLDPLLPPPAGAAGATSAKGKASGAAAATAAAGGGARDGIANGGGAAGAAASPNGSSATSWLSGLHFAPKPIQPQGLHDWIRELIDNDWIEGDEWVELSPEEEEEQAAGDVKAASTGKGLVRTKQAPARRESWTTTITRAWQNMADTLWQCAKEIHPAELPNVKQVHQVLQQLTGIDLYYAVVTREIAALKNIGGSGAAGSGTTAGSSTAAGTTAGGKKAVESGAGAGAATSLASKTAAADAAWLGGPAIGSDAFAFSLHFETLRRETMWSVRQAAEAQAQHLKATIVPGSKKALVQKEKAASSPHASLSAAMRDHTVRDELGETHRRALARAVREQGNAAYAAGDYQEATEHYTRAIGYDATEAIFPLNRAACLLKLKRFAEAERDCSAALLLDPLNHKAYFRRGVSRAALLKVQAAKADFDQVLSLQDSNTEAKDGLRKLSEHFLAEARRREAKANGTPESPEQEAAATATPAPEGQPAAGTQAKKVAATGKKAAEPAPTAPKADKDKKKDDIANSAAGQTPIRAPSEPLPAATKTPASSKAGAPPKAPATTAATPSSSSAAKRAVLPDEIEEEEDSYDDDDDDDEEEEEEYDEAQDDADDGWTDTDVTSSPSAGDGKASLRTLTQERRRDAQSAHARVSASSSSEAAPARRERVFSTDPLEVAQQVAFAFVFGQVVKQRTGVDVTRQMGFLSRRDFEDGWAPSAEGCLMPPEGYREKARSGGLKKDEAGARGATKGSAVDTFIQHAQLASKEMEKAKAKGKGKSSEKTSSPSVSAGGNNGGFDAHRDEEGAGDEERHGPFGLSRQEAMEMVESFWLMVSFPDEAALPIEALGMWWLGFSRTLSSTLCPFSPTSQPSVVRTHTGRADPLRQRQGQRAGL